MRNVPENLREVAEKMAKVGRTEYKIFRRPRLKEYTLVKYDGKRVISRERVIIDESEIFPSDEDFFWEPEYKEIKKAA